MTDTDPQSQIDELRGKLTEAQRQKSPIAFQPDPREAEIAALRMTVNSRDARIADLTQQRDYWRNAGEAEIAELRAKVEMLFQQRLKLIMQHQTAEQILHAKLVKAATALEPFAQEAKAYAHVADNVYPIYITRDGDEMDADFTAGDLRQAAAILRELQAIGLRGMIWQTIETAPRGQKILAGYWNGAGQWRTITARYFHAETLESEHEEDGWAHEGWYEESETHDELLPTDEPLTHWMPLPAPPAETKEPG